ncbi:MULTISPECIES: hypothetical protein [unclassified Clostridium]|uniref:hypothetical protein n=1 Tax=unclassified Clostridium TaxID=2614128 RepID=UPI0025BC4E30|nr:MULTISPECIES: hypothetical protein [unclassified Clostridium]
MWERIEETVDRAISGMVYARFGAVGFETSYDINTKEIHLIVYDKSYKCPNKNIVIDKKFKYNLENTYEFKAKHDVIGMIEKYFIENY